mgnify:FL=1
MSMITLRRREQLLNVVASATNVATNEALDELQDAGVLNEENFQRVLSQGNRAKEAVKVALKVLLPALVAGIVGCLKLISGGVMILIGATDGTETPSQSDDVFDGYIDGDFIAWGLDVQSAATPKVQVEVYEMVADSNFRDMFGSFGENLDRLRFSWPQVKKFAKDHRNWLRTDGYATLFLFTKAGEPINEDKSNLFVADVRVVDDGRLEVCVFRFSYDGVWGGGGRLHVVVPQL